MHKRSRLLTSLFMLELSKGDGDMIKLVVPSKELSDDVFAYKQEMIENGDSGLSGCGGLDKAQSYDVWIDRINEYSDRNKLPSDSTYVEGSQWLLFDVEQKQVLGMVNIRHYLSDDLLKFGGHIGYSVRPSERRKGYAKKQLQFALELLKDLGETKILVTCDDNNIGSSKVIESCGGVLENKLHSDEYGLVRRYWIDNK